VKSKNPRERTILIDGEKHVFPSLELNFLLKAFFMSSIRCFIECSTGNARESFGLLQ
jgi:hypothetical protein